MALSAIPSERAPVKAGSIVSAAEGDNVEKVSFETTEGLGFSEAWQLIFDRETSIDLSQGFLVKFDKGTKESATEGSLESDSTTAVEGRSTSTESKESGCLSDKSLIKCLVLDKSFKKCLQEMKRFSKRWHPLLLKQRFEANTILMSTLDLISIQNQLVDLYRRSSLQISSKLKVKPLVLWPLLFEEALLLDVFKSVTTSGKHIQEFMNAWEKKFACTLEQKNDQSSLTRCEAQTLIEKQVAEIVTSVRGFAQVTKSYFEVTLKLKEEEILQETSKSAAKQAKSARNAAKKKLSKLSMKVQDASICLGLEGVSKVPCPANYEVKGKESEADVSKQKKSKVSGVQEWEELATAEPEHLKEVPGPFQQPGTGGKVQIEKQPSLDVDPSEQVQCDSRMQAPAHLAGAPAPAGKQNAIEERGIHVKGHGKRSATVYTDPSTGRKVIEVWHSLEADIEEETNLTAVSEKQDARMGLQAAASDESAALKVPADLPDFLSESASEFEDGQAATEAENGGLVAVDSRIAIGKEKRTGSGVILAALSTDEVKSAAFEKMVEKSTVRKGADTEQSAEPMGAQHVAAASEKATTAFERDDAVKSQSREPDSDEGDLLQRILAECSRQPKGDSEDAVGGPSKQGKDRGGKKGSAEKEDPKSGLGMSKSSTSSVSESPSVEAAAMRSKETDEEDCSMQTETEKSRVEKESQTVKLDEVHDEKEARSEQETLGDKAQAATVESDHQPSRQENEKDGKSLGVPLETGQLSRQASERKEAQTQLGPEDVPDFLSAEDSDSETQAPERDAAMQETRVECPQTASDLPPESRVEEGKARSAAGVIRPGETSKAVPHRTAQEPDDVPDFVSSVSEASDGGEEVEGAPGSGDVSSSTRADVSSFPPRARSYRPSEMHPEASSDLEAPQNGERLRKDSELPKDESPLASPHLPREETQHNEAVCLPSDVEDDIADVEGDVISPLASAADDSQAPNHEDDDSSSDGWCVYNGTKPDTAQERRLARDFYGTFPVQAGYRSIAKSTESSLSPAKRPTRANEGILGAPGGSAGVAGSFAGPELEHQMRWADPDESGWIDVRRRRKPLPETRPTGDARFSDFPKERALLRPAVLPSRPVAKRRHRAGRRQFMRSPPQDAHKSPLLDHPERIALPPTRVFLRADGILPPLPPYPREARAARSPPSAKVQTQTKAQNQAKAQAEWQGNAQIVRANPPRLALHTDGEDPRLGVLAREKGTRHSRAPSADDAPARTRSVHSPRLLAGLPNEITQPLRGNPRPYAPPSMLPTVEIAPRGGQSKAHVSLHREPAVKKEVSKELVLAGPVHTKRARDLDLLPLSPKDFEGNGKMRRKVRKAKPAKSEAENLDDAFCCICFELPKTTALNPCGHLYCGTCADVMQTKRKTCPICSRKIESVLKLHDFPTRLPSHIR